MSERLEKLGQERERARQRRDSWEERFKELDRKYVEQENLEYQMISRSFHLTPEQLERVLKFAESGKLGLDLQQAVGAEPMQVEREEQMEDQQNKEESTYED